MHFTNILSSQFLFINVAECCARVPTLLPLPNELCVNPASREAMLIAGVVKAHNGMLVINLLDKRGLKIVLLFALSVDNDVYHSCIKF